MTPSKKLKENNGFIKQEQEDKSKSHLIAFWCPD
jgi:hypothetical protein